MEERDTGKVEVQSSERQLFCEGTARFYWGKHNEGRTVSKVLSYFEHQPFSEVVPAIGSLKMYINITGLEYFRKIYVEIS